ncbi:ferritin-like domain-containing protein [Paraliomyxa miuraensis]|uniref:ferritin-like domain-containing protein n=1 Tax=Paraliomyxa miuraensis TaxID=376150 RepID=UPI00225422E3|nr:ferritin-like domain-containing protein [Paraliomyxa miuraensis]MCX4240470.1 ferritin-like protein [Paraliomyxa miuraensis]
MPKYRIPKLSDEEKHFRDHINKTWDRDKALSELKSALQLAVEVELATIPIYLYTYYSIDRKPNRFPDTPLSRWADEAGALIMSVAVEEMLHMSLASNILYSLGGEPQLYKHSPGPYPTNLPHHDRLGPDARPLEIPLAKLSFEQLWRFLEIEYPAKPKGDKPQGNNWDTIGQLYSYIRCIIESKWIDDKDFQVRGTTREAIDHQIQSTNYSPNNIDTAYPKAKFAYSSPPPVGKPGSASEVVVFTNAGDDALPEPKKRPKPHPDDGHYVRALISITNEQDALAAIATIDFEGEGWNSSAYDDATDHEHSHFYKYLIVQSKLVGYPDHDDWLAIRQLDHAILPPKPEVQLGPQELGQIVFNLPPNPVAASWPAGRKAVANLASALYQYMLIMSETVFRVPTTEQKVYFNRSMHMSMIWILDKLLQAMRKVPLYGDEVSPLPDCNLRLSCPFDNIDLGDRSQAYANLAAMAAEVDAAYGQESWYQASDIGDYVKMIPTLPDVSPYWAQPPSPYAGAPRFPASPPAQIPNGGSRHACMGLNSCRNQGRTLDNACAGQGYCSTALEYNGANPQQGRVSDHTCHVKNDCAGQGGCGLYGTPDEQESPGANDCRSLGSCATPINAERFSTAGSNQGKSVWLRAREVFAKEAWPALRERNPALPPTPPPVPGTPNDPDLFAYGPTIEWIEDYSGQGMTACGASGLSGAGSCA